MDTHIKGPRGGNSHGALVSAHGVRVAFGDAAQTGKNLFRTTGASPTNPIFVRITGKIITAFDATGVAAKIITTTLAGASATDVATLGALTGFLMLTADRIFKLVYTGSGDGTVGEAGYLIEIVGPGEIERVV